MPTVRHTDGIRIDLKSGATIVADASTPDGDCNVLSHAHGDHLYSDAPDRVFASELTLDLAHVRRPDEPRPARDDHPDLRLLNAGHVPGSRALLYDDGETSILYTGDCATRDRLHLECFEPVSADILIIESTYGKPNYRFPPQAELEAEIVDWLEDTTDVPLILFGYTLGRAQELALLTERAGKSDVYVSSAIERVNDVIEAGTDTTFDVDTYDSDVALGPGDVLIMPSQTAQLDFIDAIQAETDAITAGFSGWALDDSFIYRRDLDRGFVLSDHCDFDELCAVVEAVDPEQVYVQHGFDDAFATHVTSTLGYPAQSLRQNQTTLGDF